MTTHDVSCDYKGRIENYCSNHLQYLFKKTPWIITSVSLPLTSFSWLQKERNRIIIKIVALYISFHRFDGVRSTVTGCSRNFSHHTLTQELYTFAVKTIWIYGGNVSRKPSKVRLPHEYLDYSAKRFCSITRRYSRALVIVTTRISMGMGSLCSLDSIQILGRSVGTSL